MRLPRLRLRGLMILIALASVASFLVVEAIAMDRHSRKKQLQKQLRAGYLQLAESYALKEAWSRQKAVIPIDHVCADEQKAPWEFNPEAVQEKRESFLREAEHFGVLKRKYEFAACHPLLPIDPDPPGPVDVR